LAIQDPSFEYWLNTSQNLREAVEAGSGDAQALFFCTDKAVKAANSDLDLVKAQNVKGIAHFYLNDHADAIAVFDDIINHLGAASNPSLRNQVAAAHYNKGIALRKVGRSEDSIASFGDVVDRFGTSSDTRSLEMVACALSRDSLIGQRL
jgi:tetratricopeptide (TPR) repeat protein